MAPPISADAAGGFGEAELLRRRAGRGEQRHQRQQRHDRHVLEQQDREGALAVGLLQVAALLQDAQRDRGGGEREREARDQRAAPVEQCRSRSARPAIAAAVSTSCATPRPKMSRRIASRRDSSSSSPIRNSSITTPSSATVRMLLGRVEDA